MTVKYNNFSQLQMIFKVQFGKQIHLVNSSGKQKINQFLNVLPNVFKAIPERFTLSYLDEDGDEITLNDQSDYQILLKSGLKNVRITIRENNEVFIEATNLVQFQEPRIESIQQQISEIKIVNDISLPEQPSFEQNYAQKKTEMVEEFEPKLQKFDESLIEQKLKQMLPSIISQIKAKISQDMTEKSRLSIEASEKNMKNDPIITEEPLIHERIGRISNEVVHYRVNCDGCGQKGIVGIRYKCAICPDFDFCERCEATIEHNHPFLKIRNLRQTPKKILVAIEDENESIQINGQRSQVPPCLSDLLNHGFSIVEGFLANKTNQEAKKETRPQYSMEKQDIIEKKEEVSKTEEMVIESKLTVARQEKNSEKMQIEQSYEQILNKANYLVEVFDLKFEKCIKYAERFPHFSKEELLNYCISCCEFFEETK